MILVNPGNPGNLCSKITFMQNQTKVGVGVLIIKDGKILLKKRKSIHGTGEWEDAAGGHLEHLESFEGCARREVREELGIEIDNIRFLCVSNIRRYAPKHYVDIGLVADWKSGKPKIMEQDKAEELGWYDLDSLPQPIAEWTKRYLEAYKSERNYFDE